MKLIKPIRIFDMVFVWLLGIGVGCIVACGAFAAPVVFGAATQIPHLEVADSGFIMGQIFIKCGKLFNILAGIMIVYEVLTLATARIFASSMQRRAWFILGGISVIMILLFTLYYTPEIMSAQAAGETNTQEFYSMHKQSELVFQILLITLCIEAIWRGVVGSLPFNATNANIKSCCS